MFPYSELFVDVALVENVCIRYSIGKSLYGFSLGNVYMCCLNRKPLYVTFLVNIYMRCLLGNVCMRCLIEMHLAVLPYYVCMCYILVRRLYTLPY